MIVLQEPIKNEFGLSDLQLGLMNGPAFALLYVIASIPIARLAERANRITIIAIAVACWSAMTALCGLAGSFTQMLLARSGVSIGEAGCAPASQSVISDYFPADRRATALAIWALGLPVGGVLAALSGGILADRYGWRMAFFVLGVPGLVVAVLLKLTVREPPRTALGRPPTFFHVIRMLGAKRTFRHAVLGAAIAMFVASGSGQYGASFLLRVYHLSLTQVALAVGLLVGIFQGLGIFLGGFMADRLAPRYPTAIAWLPGTSLLLAAPITIAALGAETFPIYLPLALLGMLSLYPFTASMYAIPQGIASPDMRATAAAIVLVIVSVVGLGLGPPAVGVLSDWFASQDRHALGVTAAACHAGGTAALRASCARASSEGLRHALMACTALYVWAGVHFILAARTLREDWVA